MQTIKDKLPEILIRFLILVFVIVTIVNIATRLSEPESTPNPIIEYPYLDDECPCRVIGWNNERIIMNCQCEDSIGKFRCHLTVYNSGIARSNIVCDRKFGALP